MAIYAVRRYLDGSGRNDTPAKQEARVREGFTTAFGALGVDHDETFRVAIDQLVTLVLGEGCNSTDPGLRVASGTALSSAVAAVRGRFALMSFHERRHTARSKGLLRSGHDGPTRHD